MPPVPQASSILASLGQAAFLWDLTADTIAWSDNAGAVFTDIPAEALVSGSAFARLIEPSQSIRNEALAQSAPARELVPVTQVHWSSRAAPRPDPTFVAQLIATADRAPQTRGLRRASRG